MDNCAACNALQPMTDVANIMHKQSGCMLDSEQIAIRQHWQVPTEATALMIYHSRKVEKRVRSQTLEKETDQRKERPDERETKRKRD